MIVRNRTLRNQQGGNPIAMIFVLIEMVFVVFALILAIAFVLGLLGANPSAPFAEWIYARERALMQPFSGILPDIKPVNSPTIHTSVLAGIVIYALIAGFFDLVARKLR